MPHKIDKQTIWIECITNVLKYASEFDSHPDRISMDIYEVVLKVSHSKAKRIRFWLGFDAIPSELSVWLYY